LADGNCNCNGNSNGNSNGNCNSNGNGNCNSNGDGNGACLVLVLRVGWRRQGRGTRRKYVPVGSTCAIHGA